jgi:hypothetical protein
LVIELLADAVTAQGRLELVVEWPAYGIVETRRTLEARPLLDASRRAVELWPAPSLEDYDEPPAPVVVPDGGGFFARSAK